ncbi:MAG: DVUA0089 family protein, partial [Planctomycetales bacterium]|nr:DVUA0089 family protein [Planctomycetales bacterium]
NLDPASIADSIQVTRSGFDGQFERASVLTDLGTSGQVVFQFAAVAPGEAGNGISLVFTKSNHGGSSLPTVTVSGRQINVDLNTNSGNETTASDLLTAMTNSAAASSLVTTSLELGNLLARVDQNVSVGAPLTLAGANHAKVSSSFNAGSNVQLSFTAAQTGLAGNGIQIAVTKVDRGGPATPRVTVSGRTINLELNSHLGNETTAQEVVTAVNGNATARALVTARLNFGSGLTKLGNRTLTFSPLRLAGANDVVIQPGHLELAENGREVIFRFADNLPDDRYRIDILGAGANPLLDENGLPFNGGRDQSVEFRLDLAPRVEAVVPQPITRTSTGALQQARNQIVVYFNHDHLQGDTLDPVKASDPSFYKLYLTKGTVRNTDDTLIPASVSFDATTETATLTFANDLQQLAGNTAAGGTFRLRIGTDEAIPAVPVTLTPQNDPGSSFDTALDLAANWSPNASPSQSIVISSSIANANPYLLDFPGASDEPGHREIPSVQDHVPGGADDRPGITTIPYNFRLEYGFDSRNNVLLNSITENQKQRAREVFELYGNYLGVQFIETASQGMTIVTGDLRAINPTIPTGIGAPYSLSNAQGDLVIMELQDFNQPGDDIYGGDWFRAAFKEIGRALGYGPTTELPGLSLAVDTQNPGPTAEPIFPGDADVLHGQFMYRPESNDIDLYQFTLTQTGRISIETFAERQANPSLVDTVITLYRENANGTHELVARNDDYYSNDSFLELELGPGKYFVGVSASGNNQYNPTIEDSGIGGTTGDDPSTPNIDEGAYELRLNFRPNADDSLTDSTGVVFDGDADGVPGGVHNFWFRTQSAARTLIVDKSAPAGGNGSLAAPYSNLQTALTAAAAQPNSIVRIVGNGGADGDLTTEADNDAYEIGFNRLGNQLADGPRFEVPKDVTVMIDAGAVFKLRRAMVAVGSTAVNVDHSGASLQVLGTPRLLTANGQVARDSNGQVVEGSVFFTSIHDNAIGDDTNADVSHPAALPGDWGGIWYRNDIDSASKRFDWENEGIYLNVVNHADMRYGGGDVIVSGVTQPVAPIHMTDSRPTVSYNTITGSADAAMSANPDSFKETSFHTTEFQQRGAFTADYTRVGPDIQFNHLTDNSFNALFVRLRTPAGNDLETLTVPGRFDDTDVVHVIAENLLIEGVAGGPISQVATPPTQLVKLDPLTGGTLPLGTYNYRLTYVDAQGNESPASDPSRDITLTGGQTAVLLSQLPR